MSLGKRGGTALEGRTQSNADSMSLIELNDLASLGIEGYKPPLALDHSEYGGLTVICAEPGMGKSHIATLLGRAATDSGRKVFRYSFDDADSACISRRMVRRCSDVRTRCQDEHSPLMIIDGVTPGDEYETQREAAAVERLVAEGVQVVVCIRPESEQLAERLNGARAIRTDQLLFRPYDEDDQSFEMTGGIPSLVVSQQVDRSNDVAGHCAGPRYLTALESIVARSLRHGLTDEELRVRLGMLLLGEGRAEDIAMVSGRCDAEQLYCLAHDSALFGIDVREGAFCCHGLHLDEVLEQCLGALQGVAANLSDVVVRACSALATQGRTRRSALVCRLCSSKRDFASVGTSWGVLFAAVGEGGLVEEALRAVQSLGMPPSVRVTMSRVAVASVMKPCGEVDAAAEELAKVRLSTSAEQRLYHTAEQMLATRDVFRSPRQSSRCLTADPGDAMGLAFIEHQRVSRLLKTGRFSEAYSLISNEMSLRNPTNLPEAFVCDDLIFALALCGGRPDDKELRVRDDAERVFARSGMRHMRVYHRALMSAAPILMGDSTDTTALEEASARAERMGDSFFHAFCLLVSAIADVRMRALTRAHVRAERATTIARALGEGYLLASARLVDALACELLGDAGALVSFCDDACVPEGLMLIGRLTAAASGSMPASYTAFDIPLGAPCPRDELWALNMLADSGLAEWKDVAASLPPTWIEQLRIARGNQCLGEDGPASPAEEEHPAQTLPPSREGLGAGAQTQLGIVGREQAPVHVSVFGGFSVECDGTKVPDATFERRRARDLMMLLTMVAGHRMRRYQMIEVLWPNDDYCRGTRRLYEATGEARRCLREFCGGINPLKVDRAQGSICFDPNIVVCDVDEFEREARKTLAESGDDFLVLEHGRKMVHLFKSGPDERLALMGDIVKGRVDEIKQLFVDASVAVGEAALRLGKAKLAIRYGTDAHKMDELREDVVLLLVRALKAAGRTYEIRPLYREYSRKLMDALGTPPSMELRRAVELATSQG